MAYCEVTDLLLNSVQLSTSLSRQKFIDDAADEIDSYLGWRYITPIDVLEGSVVPRPVRLTLKRVNAHLASGRLVLAAAMSSEDDDLHAYGRSLVNESLKTVREMAEGNEFLPGVPVEEGNDRKLSGGPLLISEDSTSLVDSFYDRFNPFPISPPSVFSPSPPQGQTPPTHSHDLYATSASVAAILAAHADGADPHSEYLTQAEGDTRYLTSVHTHSLDRSGSLSAPVLIGGVFAVTVTSNWGLTLAGTAYYDPDGAAPADAAMATIDAGGSVLLTRPGA